MYSWSAIQTLPRGSLYSPPAQLIRSTNGPLAAGVAARVVGPAAGAGVWAKAIFSKAATAATNTNTAYRVIS